jgi:hypothetical protein
MVVVVVVVVVVVATAAGAGGGVLLASCRPWHEASAVAPASTTSGRDRTRIMAGYCNRGGATRVRR